MDEEKQRRRLLGDQSRIIKNYHDRRNENWRIVEGKMLDGMDEEAVTGCMRDLYGVNRLRKGRRKGNEWRSEKISDIIQRKVLHLNWMINSVVP